MFPKTNCNHSSTTALVRLQPPALGGPGAPLPLLPRWGGSHPAAPFSEFRRSETGHFFSDFLNRPWDFPNFLHAPSYDQCKNKSLLTFFPNPPKSWFFMDFFDPNLTFFHFFRIFRQKSPTSSTQHRLQVNACGKPMKRREF